MTDDAPLMKLGPAFAIDLELESEDPEKHPIAPKRRVQRTETIDSDILAVNVPDGTKILCTYVSLFSLLYLLVLFVLLSISFCYRWREYSTPGRG